MDNKQLNEIAKSIDDFLHWNIEEGEPFEEFMLIALMQTLFLINSRMGDEITKRILIEASRSVETGNFRIPFDKVYPKKKNSNVIKLDFNNDD